MTEQSARDTILKNTLQVLVAHVDLSPAELVQLRLSDLHLAGKSPNISFIPVGSDDPKSIELDLEAHRALVGWLVARPDSKSDFLFPGSEGGAMDPQAVERLVKVEAPAEKSGPEADVTERAEEGPSAGTVPPPPAGNETIISASRPVPPPARPMPPPSRPVHPMARPEPPPTRPEMGPPPESPEAAAASLRPRPSAPELDNVDIPLPTAAPKPPPPPAESGDAVDLPDDIPAADAETDKPEAATPEPIIPPAAEDRPETVPESVPPPAPVRTAGAKKAAPARMPVAAPPPEKGVAGAARPQAPLTAEEAAAKAAGYGRGSGRFRLVMSGSIVVILLTCLVCLGGGWLAAQSGPGQSLLAMVGLSSQAEPTPTETASVEPTATSVIVATAVTAVFESPLDSPLPTPTATPTEPPTATPAPPTETATVAPTNTPAPPPTNTPVPTDTPAPTNTPVSEEPAETPTPEEPLTPAMKYDAPVLVEPEDGFAFIQGNTIVLRWEPVGELAPDEQYAVRMVYRYQNEPTYQGANIKESEWLVPLSLFGQIDGPDYLYEWYVSVERLNDDGSGTSISPESERRTFTWR